MYSHLAPFSTNLNSSKFSPAESATVYKTPPNHRNIPPHQTSRFPASTVPNPSFSMKLNSNFLPQNHHPLQLPHNLASTVPGTFLRRFHAGYPIHPAKGPRSFRHPIAAGLDSSAPADFPEPVQSVVIEKWTATLAPRRGLHLSIPRGWHCCTHNQTVRARVSRTQNAPPPNVDEPRGVLYRGWG